MVLGFLQNVLADNVTLRPGQPHEKIYSIAASPSYTVSFDNSASTGMRCSVRLDLNDLQNPRKDGKENWKMAASITLVKDVSNYTKTLRPVSFKFVKGRSNLARL